MIFLRINCPNVARHVASCSFIYSIWRLTPSISGLQVVTGVSRQIEYMNDLYDIRYDTMHYIYVHAPKRWRIGSLIFCTEPNEKKSNEKTKKRGAQKKWSVIVRGVSPEAGMESVVGKVYEKGRSWAGSKERGSYWWWEWWVDIVRKCGRSMNRQKRQRDWNEVDREN